MTRCVLGLISMTLAGGCSVGVDAQGDGFGVGSGLSASRGNADSAGTTDATAGDATAESTADSTQGLSSTAANESGTGDSSGDSSATDGTTSTSSSGSTDATTESGSTSSGSTSSGSTSSDSSGGSDSSSSSSGSGGTTTAGMGELGPLEELRCFEMGTSSRCLGRLADLWFVVEPTCVVEALGPDHTDNWSANLRMCNPDYPASPFEELRCHADRCRGKLGDWWVILALPCAVMGDPSTTWSCAPAPTDLTGWDEILGFGTIRYGLTGNGWLTVVPTCHLDTWYPSAGWTEVAAQPYCP